jgi:hypothetical protein
LTNASLSEFLFMISADLVVAGGIGAVGLGLVESGTLGVDDLMGAFAADLAAVEGGFEAVGLTAGLPEVVVLVVVLLPPSIALS